MNIFLDTCHTQHKSIFICVKNTHTRLNTSNYPFTLISMFDHIKFMKVSEQVDQSCNGSPELFILVILYFKDVNELLFFFHCKWIVYTKLICPSFKVFLRTFVTICYTKVVELLRYWYRILFTKCINNVILPEVLNIKNIHSI